MKTFFQYCRRNLTWKSCSVRRRMVIVCINQWSSNVSFFTEQNSPSASTLNEEQWSAGWLKKFIVFLKDPCSEQTSVSDEVPISGWVQTLITSFSIFPASVSIKLLEVFSEWYWFMKWSRRVFLRWSQSDWSIDWSEKTLKKCTRERWKIAALKNWKAWGFSFRARRTLLESTPSAATWNSLRNFQDFAQGGEDVIITNGRIWVNYFQTKHDGYRNYFIVKCRGFLKNFWSWDPNQLDMEIFIFFSTIFLQKSEKIFHCWKIIEITLK